jgi:hypothetical protein
VDVPIEIATLASVIEDLARRGFTEQFAPAAGRLRAILAHKAVAPEEVAVSETYRFEGISDPDDMAILYAIETRNGLRRTLTDAFGVYSDPDVGTFMTKVGRVGYRGPRNPGAVVASPSSRSGR